MQSGILTKNISETLKFLSFNVENLEPKLDEPSFIDLLYKHDVCVLTETWKNDDTKINLPGFWDISQIRPKHRKAIRHSGGITIFVKEKLRQGVKVVQNTEGFLWLKLDKTFFNIDQDIYMCAAYIPPQYTTKNINNKTDYYTSFYEGLLKYSGKGRILIAGDLNSRVGAGNVDEIPDTPHIQDLLPQDPSPELETRSNCDPIQNAYGRKLLQMCESFNLCIANGRTPGDRLGNLTCFTKNGCSTVDYIIADNVLINNIKKLEILPPEFLSVHSPLSATIKLGTVVPVKTYKLRKHPPKIVWDPEQKANFVELLKQSEFANCMLSIKKQLKEPNMDKLNVNLLLKKFSGALLEAAKKCFKIVTKRKKNAKKQQA